MAVAGASVAFSAASPSAKLQKQDRLWGGGQVAAGTCSITDPDFCIGPARNLSVDAHAEGDGSGAVGNSAQNVQTPRTVTCLSVDGNKAAIGGVIGSTGDLYLQYFVDRGTTLPTDERDLTSAVYVGTNPWPAGFPDVCPPAAGADALPPVYLVMGGGDIVVQDAPSD